MNLPYFARLVCLCMASFFLVHLVAGLVVAAISGVATRMAERFRPHNGARFLLALRLTPFLLALCSVAGLCIPSYLWMEPDSIDEPVGFLCFIAVTLCAAIWLLAIARAVRAVVRSNRYIRETRRCACPMELQPESTPVWVTETEDAVIALAGVLRPRLILSRRILNELSSEEMGSALLHERAHRISHDNLKRLVLLLLPGVFPFSRVFRSLEQAWARLAEFAADDHAAAGDPQSSLSMAAALVRVARIHTSRPAASDLVTGLLTSRDDLPTRIDRLLHSSPVERLSGRRSVYTACGLVAFTALAASVMLRPATLSYAHGVLERLIH